MTSSTPSRIVQYTFPTPQVPYGTIYTQSLDGAADDDAQYHRTISYVDSMGRTLATLSEADPDPQHGDGFAWIASGLPDYDAKGAVRRSYVSWALVDLGQFDFQVPAGTSYGQQRYDAFGRGVESIGLDGQVAARTRYHALSVDRFDAEDLGPGPHQGTYATQESDGHGRGKRAIVRARPAPGAALELTITETKYLVTGEPTELSQTHGSETVTRTMQYDTLGRMVVNTEPSSSKNGKAWRYAYNDAGDLVGTSDARGCGVNFEYDAAGRLLSEDYSPCDPVNHEVYDTAPEVEYRYDLPDDDATVVGGQIATLGRMTSVTDLASKTLSHWDMLGRVTHVAKKVASPSGSLVTEQWFHKHVVFDGAGRPIRETTGATVNAGDGNASAVVTTYTARGKVKQVRSTYSDRPLVERIKRNAEGATIEIAYGDAANTTTAFVLDDLRRARNVTTYRAKPDLWSATPTPDELYSHQLLLSDVQFTYDRASNPTEVRDWRVANEWPAGAKPVTRKMQYDDLYRLVRIDYQSPDGADMWVDPYQAEANADPSLEKPAPNPRADFGVGGKRVMRQTFAYDWRGNLVETDDDQHAFFDRSIGTTVDDVYQLKSAANTSKGGGRTGHLAADYDPAGNLISLTVHREGTCVPLGKCNDQHFEYLWDEVGRLIEARRWDVLDWQIATHPDAHLRFAYDAGDMRVRKTVVDDASGDQRHSLYVFGSLDIRLASHSLDENGKGAYDVSARTEVPYLIANGVRLGRVVHMNEPGATDPSARVFLELGDHLGSTSIVLDLATGELVQRSTAFAYGGIDSEYRPSRWESFREEYRFTGKEDDVELGLVYFGKRYYAPALGRWISADPMTVHVPGRGGLNAYAYVDGRVLSAVDPLGLEIVTAVVGAMVIGAALGASTNAVSQAFSGRGWSWASFRNAAIAGGAGGLAGGVAGAACGVGGGAAITSGQRLAMGVAGGAASSATSAALVGAPVGPAAAGGAAFGGAGAVVTLGADALAEKPVWRAQQPRSQWAAAGEALALGGAGAGLGYASTKYLTRNTRGSDAWAAAGMVVGGINGFWAGTLGTYEATPRGALAFGLDSTWGLANTAVSFGSRFELALNPNAAYVPELSQRQNREVYETTDLPLGVAGYSDANVIVLQKYFHNVAYHESVHTWQSRLAGPYFWPTVWATQVGGKAVGAVAGAAGGIPLGRSMQGGLKRNSPYEAWAYGADNDPQRSETDDALGWW